jgi:hypothetical protein
MGYIYEVGVGDVEDLSVFEDFYLREVRERKRIATEDNVQDGDGMNDYFREYDPSSEQDGCGTLDFFRGLFRAVIPVLKPIGKHLMKQGIRAGVATVGDIAQGEHWKAAAKRRLNDMGDDIIEQVQNKVQKMSGMGYNDHYLGEPSKQKALTYDVNDNPNKKIASERELFSLSPPFEGEGCVSSRRHSTPKTWFNKVAKKKKKKHQKGKGIGSGWL